MVGITNVTPIGWNVTDIVGSVETPSRRSTITRPVPIVGWAKIAGLGIARIEVWIDGIYRGNAQHTVPEVMLFIRGIKLVDKLRSKVSR